MPVTLLRTSLLGAAVVLALAPDVVAQSSTTAPTPAPASTPLVVPVSEGGRVWSMGQPPVRQWQSGLVVDVRRPGVSALFGVQKDLMSPMVGLAAARVEAVIGAADGRLEGGGRLLFVSPVGRVHSGLDIDARSHDVDVLVGVDINLRRGGIVGHGARLRIDWLPGRDNTVQVGVQLPLGQRAGRRGREPIG